MRSQLLRPLVLFLLLAPPALRSQTVITFDDLSGSFVAIPDGYQGLTWSNFFVVNAVGITAASGTNGNIYGMVSAPNVAYNGFGNPAEINSPGTNFDFLSVYLTGTWNNGLNVEVEGFQDTNLVYDETKVVSAINATLCTFDYLDIDRLYFNSYGGQAVGFGQGGGEDFVMDNFMFEFVPEPSSLLLTALGVVTLWAFLKRKRT